MASVATNFQEEVASLSEEYKLTRDVGYWESQMINDFPPTLLGPRRCQCAHTTRFTMENKKEMHLNKFQKAVENLVYNEPCFRAKVDLNTQQFVPATDFSELFTFKDFRGMNLQQAWNNAVDVESNHVWDYESNKPMYRCVLVRFEEHEYLLINTYHHSIGDGTSGMLSSGKILGNYGKLLKGTILAKNPEKARESVEVLCEEQGHNKQIIQKMVDERKLRFETYKHMIPFECSPDKIPHNRSYISDGGTENYQALRQRCKNEGITVGNLSLAATFMAMNQVIPGKQFTGMNYIDYPVNMRSRCNFPNSYNGFVVSEIAPRADHIDENTSLWQLASFFQNQVSDMLKDGEHFSFPEAKQIFENSVDTKEIAAAPPIDNILDVLLSNMMHYISPLEPIPGLKVKGCYIPGGIWCPGFGNYLLLFQSTDKFHYTAVYEDQGGNGKICEKLFDSWTLLMETAPYVKVGNDTFEEIKNMKNESKGSAEEKLEN